ncbi:hypothetical protein DL764_004749 [Monosporascus ibericus]|uniref:Uncharacterized protein n=1 Tax=Monosporascus ibericus TaxID=155417 RepID=A0A4Q4TBR3_9PEZI|nr:hypothetical protein DL764_004749 [Monosporascus ibericus]
MPARKARAAPMENNRPKRGPKPFPGTRRMRCDLRVPPPQPIIRPRNTYTRKRRTDVLMWLIHHKIPEENQFRRGDSYAYTRTRAGIAPLPVHEENERRRKWANGETIYRAPTYKDAERFWKVPAGSICQWWKKREKYLPPHELERANLIHDLYMTGVPVRSESSVELESATHQQPAAAQNGDSQSGPAGPGGHQSLIVIDDNDMDTSDEEELAPENTGMEEFDDEEETENQDAQSSHIQNAEAEANGTESTQHDERATGENESPSGEAEDAEDADADADADDEQPSGDIPGFGDAQAEDFDETHAAIFRVQRV